MQRTLTKGYDAVSNRLSMTDGRGVVTSFSYDDLNRQVAELDAYGTALQRTVMTDNVQYFSHIWVRRPLDWPTIE